DDAVGDSPGVRRELVEGIGSLPGWRKVVRRKKTETRRKIVGGSRKACRDYVPMFGETDYDPSRQYGSVAIEEQLDALGKAVDSGKVNLWCDCCFLISYQWKLYSISLLAYSPMAMGILSGKYFSAGGPSDARMNLFRG
ncbi:hypothetical protein BHE74_00051810, partial [Ensete ventricosum]